MNTADHLYRILIDTGNFLNIYNIQVKSTSMALWGDVSTNK